MMAAKILTLSERIYKSHHVSDKVLPQRGKDGCCMYKQWSDEQMRKAVDAVIISKLSVRCIVMFLSLRWVTELAKECNPDVSVGQQNISHLKKKMN